MTDTARAFLWMLGAIASFTSMTIAGRGIGLAHDTFEIMLYRSLLGIVIVCGVAWGAGTLHQITRRHLGLHGLRNISHFSGQNLWFFAIQRAPLAEVVALEFTGPIWVVLLSPLILRERITRIGLIASLIGFAGVMIIIRPGGAPLSPGLIAAAVAAIGFALSALFTRKLTRTETITCILFYLTVMQAVFGLVMAGYDGQITLPTTQTLPHLVMIGCAGLMAHFCLTTALKLAPASIVMPVDFGRLPVIALVGVALYGEPLELSLLVGAVLILAGNSLNLTQGKRPKAPVSG